jgi:hypothetical protein
MLQAGLSDRRKWPLFEKSGAKTFVPLGHWRCNQHGPKDQKTSFCSQKEALPCTPLSALVETVTPWVQFAP